MENQSPFELLMSKVSQLNPSFADLINDGMAFVPYLGQQIQNIKINRLIRRLKDVESKLLKINQLYANSLIPEDFIKERVFPIVLGDLIEDHEDAKINFILNGFINVFIEEEVEETVLLTNFDTLRNLRYMDIRRFLFVTQKEQWSNIDFPLGNNLEILKRIDVKLESLGLISTDTYWDEIYGANKISEFGEIHITKYGKKFRNFILSKDDN